MNFTIEIEQEVDGRFLAEVINFPGVLAYGQTREEAVARVQRLTLRVSGERNHKDTESAEKEE
ncbi:MAG: type II toxin-antitoxin system HicB family antitoxin [Nostoc sp.]|uniref:type II toxin-antitoxin system HicB family antitoxin n=1 Tax=Nostoc sp. TaxID=1180 RepID=UPI002FF71ED8